MNYLALGLLACAFLISGAQYSGVGIGHLAMLGILLYSILFLHVSVFFLLTVVALAVVKLTYDYFFAAQLSPNINTYLLFAVNWSAFLLVIKYANRWPTSDLARLLIWCGVLHGAFLITQFATFNFIGDLSLLNPLGAFSPNGPDPSTHLPVPIILSIRLLSALMDLVGSRVQVGSYKCLLSHFYYRERESGVFER